ncbi:hypothetical protein [Tessaracoccus sp.]
MSALRITKTTAIRISYELTAGDLKAALAEVPDSAKVTTYTYNADYRDPRETSYTDLKLEWT